MNARGSNLKRREYGLATATVRVSARLQVWEWVMEYVWVGECSVLQPFPLFDKFVFSSTVRVSVNEVYEVFEEVHEAHKYRTTVFQALNDSNGPLSRRKHKSFKYVDRIPRMQGKRNNVSPFQDLNNRYLHSSEVSSGVMTSKIDEDSDRTEHGIGSLARAHSHSYTRSTISLPAELNGGSSCDNGNPRRPLRRRNAVIGLGSSSSLLSCDQSSDEDKQRRPRQPLYGDSCIPEGCDESGDSLNYDSNNNRNSKKPNRRCASQDSFRLTSSRHPLQSMAKNAVSFDASSSMSRRVSWAGNSGLCRQIFAVVSTYIHLKEQSVGCGIRLFSYGNNPSLFYWLSH